MPSVLDAVEAKTGFTVPGLFRRMVEDGVTTYGASRKEWKETWRKRSLESPPALLLCTAQVEWLTPEAIRDWKPVEWFNPEHKFIPLAQDGSGNTWCWYPQGSVGEDVPIVMAPVDEPTATYFAPHLEGFLFRHLLSSFAEIYEDDGSDFTEAERRLSVKANVRVLAPYLRESWTALLTELADRPLVQNKSWGCLQLLTRDEAKALVARELAFERLDAEFEHQV